MCANGEVKIKPMADVLFILNIVEHFTMAEIQKKNQARGQAGWR
jgi:hypothetical protein